MCIWSETSVCVCVCVCVDSVTEKINICFFRFPSHLPVIALTRSISCLKSRCFLTFTKEKQIWFVINYFIYLFICGIGKRRKNMLWQQTNLIWGALSIWVSMSLFLCAFSVDTRKCRKFERDRILGFMLEGSGKLGKSTKYMWMETDWEKLRVKRHQIWWKIARYFDKLSPKFRIMWVDGNTWMQIFCFWF